MDFVISRASARGPIENQQPPVPDATRARLFRPFSKDFAKQTGREGRWDDCWVVSGVNMARLLAMMQENRIILSKNPFEGYVGSILIYDGYIE